MQYGEEKEGEDKRGQGLRKFVLRWTCEKAELAKLELEGRQNQSLFEDSQEINFEDLLGFFQGEDNDDVIEL